MQELQKIIQTISNRYTLEDTQFPHRELCFVTVLAQEARNIIRDLKDVYQFTHLVLLTAVDYIETQQFQLTYMLHNYTLHADIGLRVYIPRENSSMDSIHMLWKQAATYQRELKEMFGIDFPESPGVDEEFILEGWDTTPPMRREFDTKAYSEQNYFPRPGRTSENPQQHMRKKLYP